MRKLIRFELRKIFSRRMTQISLLLLLLLSALFTVSDYQNKYAFDGESREGNGKAAVEIDKRLAAEYEGILTDEKVRQMMSDFKPKADLHGMNAAYLYQNAIQSAVFARFSDLNGNWNGLGVSDVFGNEEIKIGYVDGWLSFSQNMVKIYTLLAFVIIIMTAPVFCGEYGGVDTLILTARYGKTKCPAAKAAAAVIASLTVTAAVTAVNYLAAFILYGSAGSDGSILFAPLIYTENYIPFNITCAGLLKYQILLAFTGTVSVTGITLVLSAACKNLPAALTASAAVYFLPAVLPVAETHPLFRYTGLLPLYHAQFVSLMSVEQMGNGVLYAIWAVPAALIFWGVGWFASRRIFAGHQVS